MVNWKWGKDNKSESEGGGIGVGGEVGVNIFNYREGE